MPIVWGTKIENKAVQSPVNNGTATAIFATVGVSNILVDNNVLVGFFYAINLNVTTNGKYRSNMASGTGSATPYIGGVDLGGNN